MVRLPSIFVPIVNIVVVKGIKKVTWLDCKKPFNSKNWLIHQLRRLSLKYPPRISAINKVKTVYYIKSKKGTDVKRVSFKCELCGKEGLKSTERELDHIVPVVDIKAGFTDWNDFINGLFCDESNYQSLCIPCHREKSLKELEKRLDSKSKV